MTLRHRHRTAGSTPVGNRAGGTTRTIPYRQLAAAGVAGLCLDPVAWKLAGTRFRRIVAGGRSVHRTQWQATYPDAVIVEHHDRSRLEILRDHRKIQHEQFGHLRCSSVILSAQQQHRR